jgi:transposase-like protein
LKIIETENWNMQSRRKFTKDFKQTAVSCLNSGQSVAEVGRALEVHPSDLHRWRRELQEHGGRAFNGAGKNRAEQSRVVHAGTKGRPTGHGNRMPS